MLCKRLLFFIGASLIRQRVYTDRIADCCVNNQRRLLFWKKCTSSDNPVLRTLAMCCRDAVGAVCDLYKLTTHDLVVLPVYIVKQLIWDCFQRTVNT